MTTTRRVGSTGSKTRAAILDAAEQIMIENGYAAVNYRSAAAKAGVTAGLVQYYFPYLDELFIALLRTRTDIILERLASASKNEQPLRAVWQYASNPAGTALLMEFMALANHRKAVAPVIGEGGERIRKAQLQAVNAARAHHTADPQDPPAAALLFLMSCIPRMIHLEESFGTVTGHAETIALVEQLLDQLEPRSVAAEPPA